MKTTVLRLQSGVLIGAAAACAVSVAGQSAPVVSRPVVQALPNADTQRLSTALSALGRNPRDVEALVDAGDAASGLGDSEAALGFYRRADEAAPNNARAKAGLARSYMKSGDPVRAISYFDAAERAGASSAQIASDRGLAYDLVGDNVTAQKYYAAAMAAGDNDDLRMRLALSQAMAGDQKSAEATLMPLLRKQDKPGWRTRAFAIAIGGDAKKAEEIVSTILPPQLAENIAPYLRYMPRLTKAQQAAAANLGKFPRASEIGRDDPHIAAYSPPRLASADAGLVPKGQPLDGGGKSGKPAGQAKTPSARALAAKAKADENARKEADRRVAARKEALASAERGAGRIAPPEPKPAIESTGELPPVGQPVATSAISPSVQTPATQPSGRAAATRGASIADSKLAGVAPGSAVPSASAPTRSAAAASVAPAAPGVSSQQTPAVPAPGFDLAKLPPQAHLASSQASSSQAASSPAASLQSAPAQSSSANAAAVDGIAGRPSLSEIFAEFGKPALQAVPVSGAVDIRTIEPPRVDPEPEPEIKVAEKPVDKPKPKKPAPPAHPSRIWVQVGVGRDKSAIAFDWRRYAKQAPELFKGRKAYVSEMGRTNRILAGPFETQKAANQFIADLKKAGFDDALPWTSPAGQVVDALPGD